MWRERGRRARSTSARRSRRTRLTTMSTTPMARASGAYIGRRPLPWGGFRRAAWACTTCTAMSGNGFGIACATGKRTHSRMDAWTLDGGLLCPPAAGGSWGICFEAPSFCEPRPGIARFRINIGGLLVARNWIESGVFASTLLSGDQGGRCSLASFLRSLSIEFRTLSLPRRFGSDRTGLAGVLRIAGSDAVRTNCPLLQKALLQHSNGSDNQSPMISI